MESQGFCQSGSCKINQKQIIAAFDFDGTITTHDSLPHFFQFVSGSFKTLLKLIQHIPLFILCLLHLISRQKVKEHLIKSFFGKMPIENLRKKGEEFSKKPLHHIVKKEALEKIKWHLNEGHTLVLISANLDVYLNSFAKDLGFDTCIVSKVDFDEQGLVTGQLKGLNCWGEEKVNRLTQIYGKKENYILYAYGNSRGDKELLQLADYPFYRCF